MKQILTIMSLLLIGLQSLFAQGKKDYLHVPGPLKFENTFYFLSDSYHPEEYYYKQEYIPKGESADKFISMITIDVLTVDMTVKDVVTKKIEEIKEMQKTDPIVKYELYEQSEKGEYMLDFLLSQTVNGHVQIIEWNLYRYKLYSDQNGKKGVILYAYTMRGYESKTKEFLTKLKENRKKFDDAFGVYKIPAIQINK